MAKTIFTKGNPKLLKGESLGFYSIGLSFLPSNLSGTNLCKFASPQCRALCLNSAGRGQMSNVQKARLNRTLEFLSDKRDYCIRLATEIKKNIRYCTKKNLTLAIRLNVLSDIDWSEIKLNNGQNLFEAFPDIQFYDYTKDINKLLNNVNS